MEETSGVLQILSEKQMRGEIPELHFLKLLMEMLKNEFGDSRQGLLMRN